MAARSTLRLFLADGERYAPLYERLPEFTAATGIEVSVVRREPSAALLPELPAALRAGEAPHLVSGHSRCTAALAGALLPLDSLLPAEELAEFDPVYLEACSLDGRPYQLPRSVETRLLYYRADVFDDRRERQWFAEASGGRELRVPASWEELAAMAQYFTREGRMHGFCFPGRGPGLVGAFAGIMTTVGGTFFDADGRPRFLSRAGEWALGLLHDLYRRWEAVPPETPELDEEDVAELFRLGRCALAGDFTGTARLLCDPTFSAVAGWHSVALYPAGPDNRRAVWTGCPAFGIPAACPDPEAAAELLLFLTSRESQLLEAKHGSIPSRRGVFEQVKENQRPGTLGHLRFTLGVQTLRLASLWPPVHPEWPAFEERFWPLLRDAVTGEVPPARALELGMEAAGALAAPAGNGPPAA